STAKLKVVSDTNWRKNPKAGPGKLDDDVLALIWDPNLPDVDKSGLFHSHVIRPMFLANFNIAEITDLLGQFPRGVAERYISEGRLPKMVADSFDKIRADYEAKLAAFQQQSATTRLRRTTAPDPPPGEAAPDPPPAPQEVVFPDGCITKTTRPHKTYPNT